MFKTLRTAKNLLTGLGAILCLISMMLVFLAVKYDYFGVLRHYFYTQLPSTENLSPGNTIRYKGMDVGQLTDLSLEQEMILIQFTIERKYLYLVRKDTKLSLSGGLDLNSALFGSSLELVPGDDGGGRLDTGAFIPIVTSSGGPDLSEIVASTQEQLTVLIEKINTIFTSPDDQAKVGNFVDNIIETSHNVKVISKKLVTVTDNVNTGIKNWGDAGQSANQTLSAVAEDLDETFTFAHSSIGQFNTLLSESSKSLAKINLLVDDVSLTSKQMVEIMKRINIITETMSDITYKVNNSWLLGGGENGVPMRRENLQYIP